MAKVILFDCFGTLIEQGTQSPAKQTLAILRTRLPFPRFIVQFEEAFMTKRYDSQHEAFQMVCEAFRVRPFPIVIEKLIGVWNKNKILSKPYDDTFDALTALREKGYKLVLFANMDCFTYDFIKEKFELGNYFDVLLPSCETGLLKVNPRAFDQVTELLGVAKEDIILVGDSLQSDIRAAEAAGVRGILLNRNGRQQYEDSAPSLPELIGLLEA